MEEREEGEITEGELSDISSEEEYLLRQRLKVLESYNNVLERKEAKRRHSETQQSVEPWVEQAHSRTNKRNKGYDGLLPDLSDISGSDLENSIFLNKPKERLTIIAKTKQLRSTKKRNEARKVVPSKKKYEKLSKHLTIEKKVSKSSKIKTHKEKNRKHNARKKQIDSSDETDYEYRNKRRRLQHSVQINNNKTDVTSSTLKMRLMKMFNDKTNVLPDSSDTPYEEQDQRISEKNEECISILDSSIDLVGGNVEEKSPIVNTDDYIEPIVVSDDSKHNSNDVVIIEQTNHEGMCPITQNIINKPDNSSDALSDDDIEVLRQNALQTKSQKPPEVHQPDHISDSEDELRVICLKSKFLKKALELKRKHKLTKKIADMNSLDDILASKLDELSDGDDVSEHSHNTDIESVDMEIGVSDGPDTDDNALKENEFNIAPFKEVTTHIESENQQQVKGMNKLLERRLFIQSELESETLYEHCNNFDLEKMETNCLYERRPSTKSKEIEVNKLCEPHLSPPSKDGETDKHYERCVSVQSKDGKSEDVDEDEDLLRAKLLTSLSNNLALLRKKSDKAITQNNRVETPDLKQPNLTEKPAPEQKRFIINIGESDSGSDNETTKNLTKMHMKLAEKVDFQQRLDMFLKNARKESEKNIEEEHPSSLKSKSPEKFVPKAVNHLPKSGQLEYRRLVKRIAELEKLKQNRQATLNRSSKINNDENMKITFTGNETRVIQRISDTTAVDTKRVISASALENQIALSRKRIAAESSKMLRLKEESNKLSQKHKIVITELKNIRTAININKREITTVQVSLAQMRNQHQLLLKRSTTQLQNVPHYGEAYRKNISRKQNFESKSTKDISNRNKLKSVTVSVINDLQEDIPEKTLSVQLDLSSLKKTVMISKESSSRTERNSNDTQSSPRKDPENGITTDPGGLSHVKDKNKTVRSNSINETSKETSNQKSKLRKSSSSELDDYRSPLTSMKLDVRWKGDPHGILCPYEVLGACKDAECRYQHPDVRN